jgi:glycosyltransferase involved in cell wall biosynthesis
LIDNIEKEASISVIIPAYNAANFLADAVQSVLDQTIIPSEIIVVNDGSTDETELVAKKFGNKIQYLYQQNRGTASARNRGLEIAAGNLIGFLDADDVWLKNKLELQSCLLQKNPDYEIAIGLLRRIPISKTNEVKHKKLENGEYATSAGSSLFRREVFQKIGNFDEKMGFCEDVDLFLRILDSGIKVWGHEDVVQLYRRHDQNMTLDEKNSFHYLLRVFKKTVDRRRRTQKQLPKLEKMGEIMEFWRQERYGS